MPNSERIYSNIVSGYKSVSSNPGVRTDPVTGKQAVHAGVDLPVAVGTPVKTPADGQIWATGSSSGGYGNFVIVAHPNANNPTSLTMYGHLKEPVAFFRGEAVQAGAELGLSGNTGKSTGPHLHYEERVIKPGESVQFGNNEQNNIQFLTKTDFINPNTNALGFGNWDPNQLPRNDLTRTERVAQITLSDGEFESYKNQLATVETKGKSLDESYQTTSKSGNYLGRYQLGKDTGLVEAGYLDKAGNWTDYAKSQGISSVNDFLNKPAAQDDALRRLTDRNAEFLVRNDLDLHIGDKIGDTNLTGSGLLFGAHNSRGNLKDYVLSDGQSDKGDGNGFAVSNFVALGNKVQSAPVAAVAGQPTGHWEDTGIPLTDAEGNQTGVNVQTWVEDPPINTTGSTRSSTHTAASPSSSASPTTPPEHAAAPAAPSATQISPDGTSATLPNGQVIQAGSGASLSIDINGNLIVDRPAAGWSNADGSDSDIRQITTYDTKGAQIGTVIAQSLPGQSALIENGEERSFTTTQGDGKFGHTHRYCVVNTKGPANNSSWRFAA
jgi:hypothetical protein